MNKHEQILEVIREMPGLLSTEIATILDIDPNRLAAYLTHLWKRGYVTRTGIAGGYKREGYRYFVNTERNNLPLAHQHDAPNPMRKSLSDYTLRELSEELKRRGCVWDKMWVETKQYIEYEKI